LSKATRNTEFTPSVRTKEINTAENLCLFVRNNNASRRLLHGFLIRWRQIQNFQFGILIDDFLINSFQLHGI